MVKGLKSLEIRALVNNLFNTVYAPNGYTYSYRYGSLVTENFYYPMAGTNVLMNVSIAF